MAGTWEPGQAEHQKAGQSTLKNLINLDIVDISINNPCKLKIDIDDISLIGDSKE